MSTKIIIFIFLIILAVTSISAEGNVECARDDDCGNGEVCQKIGNPTNWYCVNTAGETTQTNITTNETNYTPIIVASIIGVSVIIGFIILAIILRKKKQIKTKF